MSNLPRQMGRWGVTVGDDGRGELRLLLDPALSLEAKGVFLGIVVALRKGLTCFLASFISEALRAD